MREDIDRLVEDAKAEGVDPLTALFALLVTGKPGWACERCKWAKDDEAE